LPIGLTPTTGDTVGGTGTRNGSGGSGGLGFGSRRSCGTGGSGTTSYGRIRTRGVNSFGKTLVGTESLGNLYSPAGPDALLQINPS